MMEEKLVAPCGMNCALCVSYQFKDRDLNTRGFHRKYCEGCIPRGKNCTYMGDHCTLLKEGSVRFCFLCQTFPCERLKSLDKRYQTRYGMSMIDNLKYIREKGMENFLEKEEQAWRCPQCGGVMCCHNGLCLECDLDTLRKK